MYKRFLYLHIADSVLMSDITLCRLVTFYQIFEDTTILRDVGNCLPGCTVQTFRKIRIFSKSR